MIVRMSACADASITVLTGYPIRNCTPSRFRISATAAAPFMDVLLGTGVASARADDSTSPERDAAPRGLATRHRGPCATPPPDEIPPASAVLDWRLPWAAGRAGGRRTDTSVSEDDDDSADPDHSRDPQEAEAA